jgi:hypothetical protein
MKIDLAIRNVANSEAELAKALLEVGERHRVDHDVFHISQTLASKSRESLHSLRPDAERYGVQIDNQDRSPSHSLGASLREKGAELLGSRPEAAILLLNDLRHLHLLAAAASIDWTVLGQGAQALRDEQLLATVSEHHPYALKTLNWTTTKLKEMSPQLLTS